MRASFGIIRNLSGLICGTVCERNVIPSELYGYLLLLIIMAWAKQYAHAVVAK